MLFALAGNRELYFNYLAQQDGNDGYGLLALGVVRNDNAPGAVANAFADARARVDGVVMGPRAWQDFGVDLIRADLALRQTYYSRDRPDKALNLPVLDIQASHDPLFKERGIDPDAWTPRQLLEAARRQGGIAEAEKVWSMMLDNRTHGLGRMWDTMESVAYTYWDAQWNPERYLADMALARKGFALTPTPHADPDTIDHAGKTYTFHADSGVGRDFLLLIRLRTRCPGHRELAAGCGRGGRTSASRRRTPHQHTAA